MFKIIKKNSQETSHYLLGFFFFCCLKQLLGSGDVDLLISCWIITVVQTEISNINQRNLNDLSKPLTFPVRQPGGQSFHLILNIQTSTSRRAIKFAYPDSTFPADLLFSHSTIMTEYDKLHLLLLIKAKEEFMRILIFFSHQNNIWN